MKIKSAVLFGALAMVVGVLLLPERTLNAQATGHSVALSWTASTSAASCTSPCTFGYVVLRGTTAGAENQQLNSTPVTTTTYTDSSITLTSAPQTFYYVVQAVETVGGVTVNSTSSNEVSASFPGLPAAPSALTDVLH